MATTTAAATHNDLEKGSAVHRNNARGGALTNPDEDPTSWIPRAPGHRLGNPGPLGLFSFAGTTFVLSLVNLKASSVTTPNVVVGMAIFVGGLTQLLAGMWEFAAGNTFGATAFSGYGSFWLSYAMILIPGTGIVAAYEGNEKELDNALGIFLFSWFIFTFLLLIAALRRNIGFISLFVCLTITFLLLGIAKFYQSDVINQAGGGFGIITAFIAYYCAMAEILRPDDSLFTLPLGQLNRKRV
jgi:succinate-acetate transporter protein